MISGHLSVDGAAFIPYVRYKNVAKEKSAGVALIELIDFLSFAVEKMDTR